MSDQSASTARARVFTALPPQAFGYQPGRSAHPALPISLPPAEVGRKEVPLDELSFCHLRSPSDIAEIRHLRDAIALPASALADPDFHAHEKKETRSASWALSNATASSSEPAGSFP